MSDEHYGKTVTTLAEAFARIGLVDPDDGMVRAFFEPAKPGKEDQPNGFWTSPKAVAEWLFNHLGPDFFERADGLKRVAVCGATDEHGEYQCAMPPGHVEFTATDQGVVWHKHLDVMGSSISFATTPPGYVAPKLTDLAGLWGPEDTNYLCSTHWVRFQRSGADHSTWWDETCEHCDHEKARPLFPELNTGGSGQRYRVGYYCPRADGHYELIGGPDYTTECGSKGWDLVLHDAEPGDPDLPEGEWVP